MVVPVRNGSRTLGSCLEALREAGDDTVEIIVVDDDSDDESPQIAERYADRTIRLKSCAGAASARNVGAESSGGDIIVFVDSDVIVPETAFENLRKSFRSLDSPDAVQGIYALHCPYENAASQYKNIYYHFIWTHLVKDPWLNSAASFFLAVRRSVFQKIGGFDPRIVMPTVEDAEWGHRFVHEGYRILQNREIEVVHVRKYTLLGLVRYDFKLASAKVKFLLRRVLHCNDRSVFHFGSGFAVSTARAADMIPWLMSLVMLPMSLFLLLFGRILYCLVFLIISLALQIPFFRFVMRKMGMRTAGKMISIMLMDMVAIDAGIGYGVLSFAAGKRY